ncbi:MAG: hypothetical protein GF317_13915 [Candidatus Lokiarchaeota archaeon]|nr:hypothetical protein [Candidatus Lokiarchaeota archaeon]MBD3200721.1 hypothetical protein [Candidatus Lokiarchaeota archaeon]
MELNPHYIRDHLNEIDQKDALKILREWIINSNESNVRKEALNLFGKIDTLLNYELLEHLFLSDEDIEIRKISGNLLKNNYGTHEKITSLSEYLLEKEAKVDQQLLAIEILYEINSPRTRRFIKRFLHKEIKKLYREKKKEFPERIFKIGYQEIQSRQLLEIAINLILYKYYTTNLGFNATLRNGFIILLNCEGFYMGKDTIIPEFNRLKRLEYLILKRTNLRKIPDFGIISNLKKLDLSYNNIEEIEYLNNISNLIELNLSHNNIREIKGLNSLNKLEKLFLDHNQFESLTNLGSLVNLEELNINNNNISHIEGISRLEKLKKLNLSYNSIEKISNLEMLENLHWLHLKGNNIKEITNLDSLIHLKGLYLSENQIKEIKNLNNLLELRKLEISSNLINKISGLENQKELQELFLDNNNIQNIEGLDNLENLIILFLKSNKITHFDSSLIEKLKNLNFIFLNDNPLTSESKKCYNRRTRYP